MTGRKPPADSMRGRLAWGAVCLAYVVGSVAFLWPMPAHLATRIWGDRFDAWTTLWLMDHLHRHLADGTLAAATTDILFPIGYNLWSFGHAALQVLGVGLMFLGVPLVAAYNVLFISALATSGLAAHALGRTIGGGHLAGFVAGIAFATSPYLYGEGAAGCIELVAAGLIPLYVLTLVRLVRSPTPGRAVASAAVLAIIGPFNWYYTLFAGMLGLGITGWQFAAGHRRAAAWMLAAMVVAGLANAPLIPLVSRETPERPTLTSALVTDGAAWRVKNAAGDGRVDLATLTPEVLEAHDAMQVVENSTTVDSLLRSRFTGNPLLSTPGLLAFGIGAVGFAASGRRGLGWAALALGATLLTLGPFVRLDDTPPLPQWAAEHPLPYYFAYEHLPFFSKAYRPYRLSIITLTCLAALGAVGIAALQLEVRRSALVAGTFCLGVAAVLQPVWAGDQPGLRPVADATIPPIYGELAELPRGGVIELPIHYQPLTIANARLQYNQVLHGQPVLNCNQLIRRTDLTAFRDYIGRNAFLATLVDLARRAPPYRVAASDVSALLQDGFRYVVFHSAAEVDDAGLAGRSAGADLVGQPAERMLRDLFGDPVLADATAEVFQLPDSIPDPDRIYTWTGENVRELSLPLDDRRLGLPLSLGGGGILPLWEGAAREVSIWVRVLAGAGIVLRVEAAGETRDTAVPSVTEEWRWYRTPIEAIGPVKVGLVATSGPVQVRLARGQVTLDEATR